MRAGQLRHYVALQRATVTRDAHGGTVHTWATYANVWAAIEPQSGDEPVTAEAPQAVTTHNVRIRYNSSVKPTDRLAHGSRVLEINAILNIDERNREMRLLCGEVTAA